MDPVYTGRFETDMMGEVLFAFENMAQDEHVKFSGMTVRKCGGSGEFLQEILIHNPIRDSNDSFLRRTRGRRSRTGARRTDLCR